MPKYIELSSDNTIIVTGDSYEVSLEFADRTQETVYLNKVELKQLIQTLTKHQKTIQNINPNSKGVNYNE